MCAHLHTHKLGQPVWVRLKTFRPSLAVSCSTVEAAAETTIKCAKNSDHSGVVAMSWNRALWPSCLLLSIECLYTEMIAGMWEMWAVIPSMRMRSIRRYAPYQNLTLFWAWHRFAGRSEIYTVPTVRLIVWEHTVKGACLRESKGTMHSFLENLPQFWVAVLFTPARQWKRQVREQTDTSTHENKSHTCVLHKSKTWEVLEERGLKHSRKEQSYGKCTAWTIFPDRLIPNCLFHIPLIQFGAPAPLFHHFQNGSLLLSLHYNLESMTPRSGAYTRNQRLLQRWT